MGNYQALETSIATATLTAVQVGKNRANYVVSYKVR